LLIVVLIMGIVLGMTGSLLGGFYSMFQASEDQSSARMRAQAVFNILGDPIQNAGIGMPFSGLEVPFTFHNIDSTKVSFGMKSWAAPIYISNDLTQTQGDQLRVIYGVPTGLKYVGGEVDAGVQSRDSSAVVPATKKDSAEVGFARQIGNKQIPSTTTTSKIDPYDITQLGTGTSGATSSLVVFPGTHMMPAVVTGKSGNNLEIYTQPLHYEPSPDYLGANTIRSNHDIFMLRAGWAYVKDGTFCFLNVYDDTAGSLLSPPSAADANFSGFMVEGVAGIWFVTDTSDEYKWRFVNVEVLVEGDILDEGRDAARAKLEAKWAPRGVTLTPGVFYEEFSMVFRPRNLQRKSGVVEDKKSKAAAYLIRAVFTDDDGSEKSIETAIIQSMQE
jgi:hypothetical protein